MDSFLGVHASTRLISSTYLNLLPFDVVQNIVRESVAARRLRLAKVTIPPQTYVLKLWGINEEAAAPPATTVKLPVAKPAAAMTDAINAMATSVRDAMIAAIDIATGTPAPKSSNSKAAVARATTPRAAKRVESRASARKTVASAAAKKAGAKKAAPARRR